MADTTDIEFFDVPLKLIAVQDPGNRDAETWEACSLDVAEDARRVAATVAAAVKDHPVLQLVTDQGTPYRAAEARQTYEDLGVEYTPAKEGTPTQKPTLERSFGLVKRVLAPMVALTSTVAGLVPALRHPDLARTVGKYLIAAVLDAHRLGRESSAGTTSRPSDRRIIEAAVGEITERNRDEHGSCRLLLERIHQEYRMEGSKELFVRSLRHHLLKDIQEAERRLRGYSCRCHTRCCDRYFTAILRGVAAEALPYRRAKRQQAREECRRDQEAAEFLAEQEEMRRHPESGILRGLRALAIQWDPTTQALFMGGRGMGRSDLKRGVQRLRERDGRSVAQDALEVLWRQWEEGSPDVSESARRSIRVLWNEICAAEISAPEGFPSAAIRRIIREPPSPSIARSPS